MCSIIHTLILAGLKADAFDLFDNELVLSNNNNEASWADENEEAPSSDDNDEAA